VSVLRCVARELVSPLRPYSPKVVAVWCVCVRVCSFCGACVGGYVAAEGATCVASVMQCVVREFWITFSAVFAHSCFFVVRVCVGM